MKVLITQQIQKQARMGKLKEDWNGLQLWLTVVFKNCKPNSFSKFIFTYIHTYFIGSSPRGFSESILHYKIINQVHDNKNITMIKEDKGQ